MLNDEHLQVDQNDCLMRAGGDDAQFVISRFALWMPRVVLSIDKGIELETMLTEFT